jgi:aminopeptidase N
VLENYRREVRQLPASAPSLSTVRFNGSGFVIRYYKGSLMLNHLRQALGDEKFFQAAREFFQIYTGTTIGTAEFRGFWKQRLGNQKDSLDVWLDSPGGLPELAAGGR